MKAFRVWTKLGWHDYFNHVIYYIKQISCLKKKKKTLSLLSLKDKLRLLFKCYGVRPQNETTQMILHMANIDML